MLGFKMTEKKRMDGIKHEASEAEKKEIKQSYKQRWGEGLRKMRKRERE